jgi:hypothetical protein
MKKKDLKRRVKHLEAGLYVAYFALHERVELLEQQTKNFNSYFDEQAEWNLEVQGALEGKE